jgi:hypothetical protein
VDKESVGTNAVDKHKLTPEKVMELFHIAEDWNDIRQIMVNMNYYVSNQWIGWNRSDRRIVQLPIDDGQERITLNKIKPRVLTLLAKHTKNKIKFDVVPSTKNQPDIDAAKAANKFLQFLWNELGMTQKTSDIFLNMLVKKRCWMKTWFDSEAGTDITPKEGDPAYEKDMKQVHQGKICARVCDALTIFVDPAATCEEEIRWIIERKARDVEEVNAEYDAEVTDDDSVDYLNSYDITRINSDGISSNESKRKQNMVLVYELWYKPCKKYPDGLKITIANGKTLDYNEESGELPYALFGYIPIPGTLTYEAVVTDMIPVQRGINIKRSMIATHAKTVGNAVWTIPLGAAVDEEDITDISGGFIHYNAAAGGKPERVQAPDIPSFYDRDLANDANDLDDMSGSREVSQGSMPKGLDTLGGLQIMVEQENEKLVVAASNYEQGMKKVMSRILRLLKKHFPEEQQAKIVGEDNEIELFSFNASDLTGNEDIKIIEGSSLPEMKAAQEERIMLMWDKGAITKDDGTPDQAAFLRLMGMGDSTALFEQKQLDENNAKMENKTFEELAQNPQAMQIADQYVQEYHASAGVLQQNGVPVAEWAQYIPPNPEGLPDIWDSDNDEVHVYIHNTFRKTSRYRTLDPILRQLVDIHYQKHMDRLQAPLIAQQQAEQGMIQGQQQDQQAQQQGEQQKLAAQSQEADKGRQHQTQMKQMDIQSKIQSETIKGQIALQTASLRGSKQ